MIKEIVSGGQTGTDQAGLLVAHELGITIGGYCPKGGLDEEGMCILDRYPSLLEASTPDPDERTRLNIDHSDGTLIVVPSWPLPSRIKDGTNLTIHYAQEQDKPFFIINLAEQSGVIDDVQQWVREHHIEKLNIAGPRESNSPGIYEQSCGLFRELLPALKSYPKMNL